MEKRVITGSGSVALAVRMAQPDVVAAFPITPQTEIVEDIATFVAKKEMNARFMRVDSEHSAMAACIGASSAGARVFTATSSHGLMYMAEAVHWAAHARLPMVMAVATRALAAPWSILNEHTDFMIQHTSGWVQIMVENNQEAFDTVLQAFRIGESEGVQLPVMVGLDGFILTHASMPVEVPDKEDAAAFVGKRKPVYTLDVEEPVTVGNVIGAEHFMEHRRDMFKAMAIAKAAMAETEKAYESIGGRRYGLIDCYNCDDASDIIVSMGASSGDAKASSDALRKEGIKCGVLRVRVMRPFPGDEIVSALSKAESVSIVERAFSAGIGNILAHEVKSVLYDAGVKPYVKSYIAGLGGRDITPADFSSVVKSTRKRDTGDEWAGCMVTQ